VPVGFERAGRTIRFDDGKEGTNRGDIEGLEGDSKRPEKGGFAAEHVGGAKAEAKSDETADGAPFDGVLVVGIFFFFAEDLHD